MNISGAFTYMFHDRHCLSKMAEIALFVLLLPVPFVGLICICALLGYLAEIIRNVSNDYPRPLPAWDHIGEDIRKGVPVLLAIIIYHLPAMIALALLYAFRHAIAVSLFGGITFVGLFAVLFPLLLLYFAVAWSLLATGLVRYAETWEADSFYKINRLIGYVQTNGALILQWLVASLAASIVMLALLPVALVGLVLFIPVQGYLTGSYGRQLRASRLQYHRGFA